MLDNQLPGRHGDIQHTFRVAPTRTGVPGALFPSAYYVALAPDEPGTSAASQVVAAHCTLVALFRIARRHRPLSSDADSGIVPDAHGDHHPIAGSRHNDLVQLVPALATRDQTWPQLHVDHALRYPADPEDLMQDAKNPVCGA